MMYPERMSRIHIIGPKRYLHTIINLLHERRVVHIIDHRKDELDTGAPLDGSTQLSEHLIHTRSLIHSLSIKAEEDETYPAPNQELTTYIRDLSERVVALDNERNKLLAQQRELASAKPSKQLERERIGVLRALEANDAARVALREKHKDFLLGAERFLAVESRKAQSPLRFAASKTAFLINGWVPTKECDELIRMLEEVTNGAVHVERDDNASNAPIKLANNRHIKPYEMLLRLYTIPKYNELDPSFFIFLSFPLFFGFIIGDIGYGLFLLALALTVRATRPRSQFIGAVSTILTAGAISTTIFGFVYGEFFGFEYIGPIHLPYLLHRAHDVMSLLLLALGIGVLHITIALLTGFVEEARHHGTWKAFGAKASWLILLLGAGLIASGKFLETPTITVGSILAVIAVVLILVSEGARGLIELPAIFSNIASYARLMAVGVASAGLAIVTNELASSLFATGSILLMALGASVMVLGHLINIALGLLGSFIHGLRLNYVEFFGKFYEGGGRAYRPFGGEDNE